MLSGRKLDPCAFILSLLLVSLLDFQNVCARVDVNEVENSPLLKSEMVELAQIKDEMKKNGSEQSRIEAQLLDYYLGTDGNNATNANDIENANDTENANNTENATGKMPFIFDDDWDYEEFIRQPESYEEESSKGSSSSGHAHYAGFSFFIIVPFPVIYSVRRKYQKKKATSESTVDLVKA